MKVSPSHRLRVTSGRFRLETLLTDPPSPRQAALVLPGGGQTVNGGTMSRLARTLAARDTAVLRLNYRGVGRSTGRFYADGGAGERQDARAALDFLAERYRDLPLWVAGISFGAWIGFQAALGDRRVTRLLGVALPLRIHEFDLSFLRDNGGTPLAVVQGSQDEYASLREIRAFVESLPDPKRLLIVNGADHGFAGKLARFEAAAARACVWLARSPQRHSSRLADSASDSRP